MEMSKKSGMFILCCLVLSPFIFAQDSALEELKVEDCPNDGGDAFCITWRKLPNATGQNLYRIYWINDKGENVLLNQFPDTVRDKSELSIYYGKSGSDKYYHGYVIRQLPGLNEDNIIPPNTSAKFFLEYVSKSGNVLKKSEVFEVTSKANWFITTDKYVFIFVIIFAIVLLYFIGISKKGKSIFVRKIPGLDAIDDAIGRATEMGKPLLYITGLNPISSISTIASLSIFGYVIKKLASYGTRIVVPCFDPIVMVVAKEVAKNSYLQAGRPDLFREQDIYFVTDDQFGYVTSVNATMVKEQTATNLYMGYFQAEALLLSETGAANRSIQIAGTDATTQLPFFIVSCDYTLIGEELYAAGAYISKEPILISTLKVQDIFKIVIFVAILLESIYNSFGFEFLKYIFYVP